MSRLELPEGDQPEIVKIWRLRPEMGEAVQQLSHAVYAQSTLPSLIASMTGREIFGSSAGQPKLRPARPCSAMKRSVM